MNEAELRQLARDDRDATIRSLDTAGDLEVVRRRIAAGGGESVSVLPLRSPRRQWPLLLGAAAVVALVVAAAVVIRDDDEPAIRTDPEPTTLTTLAPPSTVSSTPEPATTVVNDTATVPVTGAPTTAVPTTVAPAPAGGVIAVDHADPPPLVEPVVLASVPRFPNDGNEYLSFAIGEREIAVRQRGTDVVTLVDRQLAASGEDAARDIRLDEEMYELVLGPGDVLYGFGEPLPPEDGSAVPILRFVATALSGDRAGEVVAEVELPAVQYTELPLGAFGHGADGVIDRTRDVNRTILGYVDVEGAPLEWTGPAPTLIERPDPSDPSLISTVDGSVTWDLDIVASPNHGGEYTGPHPPAPTSGGRVIYVDSIGDDLTPGTDFGPSAMPVVAILEPDGSGQWIRLPDDWIVAASDIWGTVLMRETADSIELAMLDDALAQLAPQEPTDDGDPNRLVIDHRCDQEGECTQLASFDDGAIVAYDPVDHTLTTLDPSGRVVRDVLAVDDAIADRRPTLVAGGPDGVVYFLTAPDPTEPVVDLVAVPTFGDQAGTVIEIATGLDGSGDTDFVPTVDGLAEVGCCGAPGEFVRPAPDAKVHWWMDSTGSPETTTRPTFEIGLRESAGLTRIDPVTDARTFFDLPGVAVGARGMPPLVGTDDGAALMLVFDQLSQRQYLVRFRTDWPANDIDAADIVLVSQDPELEVMLLEPAGTVIVRDGDRLERRTPAEIGTPGWPGRLERDPADDWSSIAPGLNDHIDANQPEWATDPLLLARQLARRPGPNEVVDATWDESSGILTITTSGFLDDSTFASRAEVVLELGDDGLYRFVSSAMSSQCQPGRGHQDFRPEPCT